ncbi:unnamed protein product [Protopolystoma xenopodis]|uniref:Uncharacterized protein n=1 Tax=Protopolystoma xenopodis TaxID=117903 RepID=A0A448X3Y0_9PLAT|nr:unnamed protein product [Protopolystoma xenopodis]
MYHVHGATLEMIMHAMDFRLAETGVLSSRFSRAGSLAPNSIDPPSLSHPFGGNCLNSPPILPQVPVHSHSRSLPATPATSARIRGTTGQSLLSSSQSKNY